MNINIDQQRIVERFQRYIAIDTRSDESSTSTPSTANQWDLAHLLKAELEALGLVDVTLDEHCYLTAQLPARGMEDQPVIGFIAHMDTAPDLTGANIHPRIVHYTGGDILLDEAEDIRLSTAVFPELEQLYSGQDIIVTDGHTLLGADDKAGIAEIMEAITYLQEHPELPHGTIMVGFTPDEEIGRGADLFDVQRFGADFAYTMDGGQIGELQYENFNAASAVVHFKGLNVHPGSAKDKMINAQLLAMEYNSYIPAARPDNTEGYDGFYHLVRMSGTVEEAELVYILRDHDKEQFELKKDSILNTAARMSEMYGADRVTAEVKDSYYNMREIVSPKMYIVDHARKAIEESGVTPVIEPIRGGTDGSKLSYMGLPCPNIFAGGHNFHGRYEYLPIPSLLKAAEVVVRIATTPVHAEQ